MDARVAIITRTKDRPVLLKRAIESVVNQSFDDWIMVIVNDGGDAEPVDALVEFYRPSARGTIKVLHSPVSRGMEAASNFGITSVTSEFLAIHDDDDTWAPEYLAIAVPELERAYRQFPRIGGVLTMANAVFERIDGNMVHVHNVEPYKPWINHGFLSLDSMLVENQFAPIQLLTRSEFTHNVGLYREDLPVLGDWDFNIRFLLSYDILVIPQVLAFYHHRIDDQGVYGNSIYAASTKHAFYSQMLRNEWLREDIAHGTIGPGSMVSLRFAIQNLHWSLQDLGRQLDSFPRPAPPTAVLQEPIGPPRDLSGQPIRNTFRLIRLWIHSDRPIRSALTGLSTIVTKGPRESTRRLKAWMIRADRPEV
jgi:glycosyltransferase involved in cell wall biosynthesis